MSGDHFSLMAIPELSVCSPVAWVMDRRRQREGL